MRFLRLSPLLLSFASLGLCSITGCGSSKPATVTGSIKVPSNVKMVDTDSVEIRFIPTGGGVAASTSYTYKDGTFKAEVLPGTYKVTVNITPYAGMPDSEKRHREMENWIKKFDEGQSTLTVEIGSEANQTITIDMDKKTVTK